MDRDSFLRRVESSRDCDERRLDAAVSAGLRRARHDRLDARKFFALAAACALSVVALFAINSRPFAAAAEAHFESWHGMAPGSAEALSCRAQAAARNIELHLGGQ